MSKRQRQQGQEQRIVLSKHARKRCRRRHIAISEIRYAIVHGHRIRPNLMPRDREHEARSAGRLVVIFIRSQSVIQIITAYWDSKRRKRPRRTLPVLGIAAATRLRCTARTLAFLSK